MKKFRGYYKKPNPETVKKWVENNKKLYGKEIKSLKEIVAYNSKIKKKDNFTSDMLIALLSGRKITAKMEDAINNIIKRNNPNPDISRTVISPSSPKLFAGNPLSKDIFFCLFNIEDFLIVIMLNC